MTDSLVTRDSLEVLHKVVSTGDSRVTREALEVMAKIASPPVIDPAVELRVTKVSLTAVLKPV